VLTVRILAAPLALLLGACAPADAPSAEARASRPEAVAAPRANTLGLDSARLAAAYTRAAELPRLRTLLVARHGALQAERRFRGPRMDAPANTKSVSKSLLSALVGIAIAEGHLTGLDQPIAPFFSQHLGSNADPRKQRITIGNLLSMQSGLESTSFGNYGAWVSSPNWVRYAITRPMVDDPGGRMLYSTGSTHLLSAIPDACHRPEHPGVRTREAGRAAGHPHAPLAHGPAGDSFRWQ
jgi:CubicO group peptidase (beta-lactamase class C family)